MPLSSEDIMAHFDGHFDNLSSAAKNSGAALDQLAATTTTQYSEIKSLLDSLKAATGNGLHSAAAATVATPTINQKKAKKRILQLEAAVHNNWHRGAFCSTHGWGVNENHTSNNYLSKNPGHVATSTCAAAAGTGNTLNKGWDDFLSRRYANRT